MDADAVDKSPDAVPESKADSRASCASTSTTEAACRQDSGLSEQVFRTKKGRRFVITTEVLVQNVVTLQVCCALLVVVCAATVLFAIIYFGFDVGRAHSGGGGSYLGGGIGELSIQPVGSCSDLLTSVPATVIQLHPNSTDATIVTRRHTKLLEQDAQRADDSTLDINDAGSADLWLSYDVWVPYSPVDGNGQTAWNASRTYLAASQTLFVVNPHDQSVYTSATPAGGSTLQAVPLAQGAPPPAGAVTMLRSSASSAAATLSPACTLYGVAATFRAQQALVSAADRKLLIIGTAISRAPVPTSARNPLGNSPDMQPWFMDDPPPQLTGSETFYSSGSRLFPSVVVLTYDIASADQPTLVGTVEVEGRLVSAQLSDDGHAQLFVEQTPHTPHGAAAAGDWLSSDVMPAYRFTPAAVTDDSAPWDVVGDCTFVQMIALTNGELTFKSNTRLLTTMTLPLSGPDAGAPSAGGFSSLVIGWNPDIPGIASTSGHLYVAQSVSGAEAYPSVGQPSVYFDVATAIMSFDLAGGNVTHAGGALQAGELPFADAINATESELFVLTTVKTAEGTVDSSAFALYNSNLTLTANATGLMPQEQPTRIHFSDRDSSTSGGLSNIFVSVASVNYQTMHIYMIQVVRGEGDVGTLTLNFAGELFVTETSVDLMRTVVAANNEEFLLVGGSSAHAALQLSFYNTTLPQIVNKPPVGQLVLNSNATVASEALHDIRALLVSANNDNFWVGLPVATSAPAGACSVPTINDPALDPVNGAHLWKLSWNYSDPGGRTLQTVASGFISHQPNASLVPSMQTNCGVNMCLAANIKRLAYVTDGGDAIMALSSRGVSMVSVGSIKSNAAGGFVPSFHFDSLNLSMPAGVLPPQTSPAADIACLGQGECCVAA